MPNNDIEDEINANRQDISRQFAENRVAAADQNSGLALSPVPVDVSITVEIYTRPLNGTAIGGHPNAANGWGRGDWGDNRGSWTKQETIDTTLTRDGQQTLADALVDDTTEVVDASAGDDVVSVWDIDDGNDTTRWRTSFRFNQTPDTVSSVDLRDGSDTKIVDESPSVSADETNEVRQDVTLTVSDGSRTDNEAITNLSTIADALRDADTTLKLAEIAVGTDSTDPTTSDTSLGSQELKRQAAIGRSAQSAIARTNIYPGEPTGASFPIDLFELGVFDNNGDLVLRVTFASESKREKANLRARSGVEIR